MAVSFSVGDWAIWVSQSGGYFKTKMGIIVEVVQIGSQPNRKLFPQLYKGSGVGTPRDHMSYVAKVGSKFYWPLVKNLKKIER